MTYPATDDTDSVADEAGQRTATGTVLDNDEVGADQPGVGVTLVQGQAANVGQPIALSYGTLTLNADGGYTYVLDAANTDVQALTGSDTLTETATYTMADSDGDPSQATLKITITGDGDITLTGLEADGTDVVVDEDDLTDGSDDTPEPTTVTQTFTVSAEDGVAGVTVGGTEVYDGVTYPITIGGSYGTLEVTGAAPSGDDVVFTYTYTLSDNTLDHGQPGEDFVAEDFAVVATDPDGDQASDTLTARVIDDVPTATDDTDSVADEAGQRTATGTVLDNDEVGADQPGVGVTLVQGQAANVGQPIALSYGTLTLNADGGYTYVLDAANTDVQALTGSDTLTETATYTMADSDGDPSQATLKITITGDGDITLTGLEADGTDVVVDEDDLTDGSDDTPEPTTVTQTFTVSAEDGVAGVTVGGTEVYDGVTYPITIGGSYGTLEVTGAAPSGDDVVFTYTYTLSDNTLDHGQPGEDFVAEDFAVVATDPDGDQASDTLTARVIDDVPTATDDTDSVADEAGQRTATGTVLDNDEVGADQPGVGVTLVQGQAANVGQPIALSYGTLTLNADGGYTYVLDAANTDVQALTGSDTLTETATYTMADSDGDPSQATLKITITGDGDITLTGLEADGTDVVVDEDDLTDGSDDTPEPTTVTQTFTVSAEDGVAGVTVGGTEVYDGVTYPITIGGSYGTLEVTGAAPSGDDVVFTYTYTLSDNTLDHGQPGEDFVAEDFAVVATDPDGDQASDTLTARVIDDVPTATDDTDSVADEAGQRTATGTVLDNDEVGADQPGVGVTLVQGQAANVGQPIALSYGTLTLNADGGYTYVLDAANTDVQALTGSDTLTETATYTMADSDGDPSQATLKITITGDGDITLTGLEADGTDVVVDEDDLTDGSDDTPEPTTVTQTFTVSAEDGVAGVTVGGTEVYDGVTYPITIGGSYGTLEVTGAAPSGDDVVFTYTYTLSDNTLDHGQPGEDFVAEDFAVVATDPDGDQASDTLTARVIDDVPTATDDTAEAAPCNEPTNVLVMLDRTGSMDGQRWTDAKAALVDLAEAYEDAGGINMIVVPFNTSATALTAAGGGLVFNSAADVQTALESISPNGFTNYDAAYQEGIAAWNQAVSNGDLDVANRSVSYFISDGVPQSSQEDTGPDIDYALSAAQTEAWEAFLQGTNPDSTSWTGADGQGFTKSYALAIDQYTSDIQESLDNLAWAPGDDPHQNDGLNDNPNEVIQVSSDGLSGALVDTVRDVTGDLLDNDTAGADGWLTNPSGEVIALTDIELISGDGTSGQVSVGDGTDGTLTLEDGSGTTLGTLTVQADGHYIFSPDAEPTWTAPTMFTVRYTVLDADGDPAQANLTLTIDRSGCDIHEPEPVALTALLDEDGTPALDPAGNPGGPDDADAPTVVNGTVAAASFGGDGPATTGAVAFHVPSTDPGFALADGTALDWTVNADGALVAYVNGSDSSNPANWALSLTAGTPDANSDVPYTITLHQALQHADPGAGAAFEDEIGVQIGVTLTGLNRGFDQRYPRHHH